MTLTPQEKIKAFDESLEMITDFSKKNGIECYGTIVLQVKGEGRTHIKTHQIIVNDSPPKA